MTGCCAVIVLGCRYRVLASSSHQLPTSRYNNSSFATPAFYSPTTIRQLFDNIYPPPASSPAHFFLAGRLDLAEGLPKPPLQRSPPAAPVPDPRSGRTTGLVTGGRLPFPYQPLVSPAGSGRSFQSCVSWSRPFIQYPTFRTTLAPVEAARGRVCNKIRSNMLCSR